MLPFAALPVRNTPLIDIMSVVVAPEFFLFKDEPKKSQHDFSIPIILGDPQGWDDPVWRFPALPGARAQAEEVAVFLKSQALIGREASRKGIESKLRAQGRTGLIHLATHGMFDMTNPVDGGFLLLADGRWYASEIQKLPLRESRPLVVMSACQTDLSTTIGINKA